MRRLAPDVFQLEGRPRSAFNVYLLDDVLLDAGTRHARRRILRQLEGVTVKAHAITHGHSDHQGSSHAVCEALGLPLWCPAREQAAVETGELASLVPSNLITRWQLRNWAGPANPVARALVAGDHVGSFEVLDTPGHSPGHISLWRAADRVLIAGDVLFNRHPVTGRPGLHEPPSGFTVDPELNRRSIHALAALEPSLSCFGHGPPLRGPEALIAFAAALQQRAGPREEIA